MSQQAGGPGPQSDIRANPALSYARYMRSTSESLHRLPGSDAELVEEYLRGEIQHAAETAQAEAAQLNYDPGASYAHVNYQVAQTATAATGVAEQWKAGKSQQDEPRVAHLDHLHEQRVKGEPMHHVPPPKVDGPLRFTQAASAPAQGAARPPAGSPQVATQGTGWVPPDRSQQQQQS